MSFPRWYQIAEDIPQHTEWLVIEHILAAPLFPRWRAARKQYPEDKIGVSEPTRFITYADALYWIKTQPLTDTFLYKTGDEAMDAWLKAGAVVEHSHAY